MVLCILVVFFFDALRLIVSFVSGLQRSSEYPCHARDDRTFRSTGWYGWADGVGDYKIPCWTVGFLAAMGAVRAVLTIFIFGKIAAKVRSSTRQRLEQIWHLGGVYWLVRAVIMSYNLVSARESMVDNDAKFLSFRGYETLVLLFVGLLFRIPHLRVTVQAFFLARGEKVALAAGIAGLLGDENPKELIERAKKRFRGVELTNLTLNHMRKTKPGTETDHTLFDLSQKAPLGDVVSGLLGSWAWV